MRQRITVEQLAELNKEQKDRLREWWQPKLYDVVLQKNGIYKDFSHDFVICKESETKLTQDYHEYYPLLSIGQCLELLQERNPYVLGKLLGDIIIPDIKVDMDNNDMELIDALWSAVKAVL